MRFPESPDIILGPPGTGKTTRLISIVEEELSQGTPPDRVAFVSFTRRAAQEAVERACTKFSLTQRDFPFFRTLHSLCFSSLGLSNSDVFEGRKVREFGDWIGQKMSTRRYSDDGMTLGFTRGDRAMFMENLARVQETSVRELYSRDDDGLPWNVVDRVAQGLSRYKSDMSLVDYTDMLQLFVRQDWSPPVDVLLVDESQDLSLLQWRVVSLLARRARRVVIAGDDDQAIYRWAGAAVEQFVDMRGRVSVLEQSWRVPVSVQEISQDVISRVAHRREKNWSPRPEPGSVRRVKSIEEIDWWEPDILVLVRNSFVMRDVERLLRAESIIFEASGRSSISPDTLAAVRIWESLRRGEEVQAADARRVYELMSTETGVARGYKTLPGVDEETMVSMDWLRRNGGLRADGVWHESLDRIPAEEVSYMVRARQKGERTTARPRVRLSTIHSAKGGEAEHVVLLTDMARRTSEEYHSSPEDEARVWYVAATRARSRLTIVENSTKMFYPL